jgi:hypothetical protein
MTVQLLDRDLERLESLWSNGLSRVFDAYASAAPHRDPQVLLAAALVEEGISLQNVGGRAADAAPLLLGDLCLARASRLLAAAATLPVQVAFARAIEQVSAGAAEGRATVLVRDLLVHALGATE